jgi:hypothetical protein
VINAEMGSVGPFALVLAGIGLGQLGLLGGWEHNGVPSRRGRHRHDQRRSDLEVPELAEGVRRSWWEPEERPGDPRPSPRHRP